MGEERKIEPIPTKPYVSSLFAVPAQQPNAPAPVQPAPQPSIPTPPPPPTKAPRAKSGGIPKKFLAFIVAAVVVVSAGIGLGVWLAGKGKTTTLKTDPIVGEYSFQSFTILGEKFTSSDFVGDSAVLELSSEVKINSIINSLENGADTNVYAYLVLYASYTKCPYCDNCGSSDCSDTHIDCVYCGSTGYIEDNLTSQEIRDAIKLIVIDFIQNSFFEVSGNLKIDSVDKNYKLLDLNGKGDEVQLNKQGATLVVMSPRLFIDMTLMVSEIRDIQVSIDWNPRNGTLSFLHPQIWMFDAHIVYDKVRK